MFLMAEAIQTPERTELQMPSTHCRPMGADEVDSERSQNSTTGIHASPDTLESLGTLFSVSTENLQEMVTALQRLIRIREATISWGERNRQVVPILSALTTASFRPMPTVSASDRRDTLREILHEQGGPMALSALVVAISRRVGVEVPSQAVFDDLRLDSRFERIARGMYCLKEHLRAGDSKEEFMAAP